MPIKQVRGLKVNSKKVLDIYAGQVKKNAAQAYKEIHPDITDASATVLGSTLINKPSAQIYLQQHIDKASQRIVELVDNDKPDIALRASQDVLDRSHGKAIQQVQQTTTGVTLVIDLTSSLAAQA